MIVIELFRWLVYGVVIFCGITLFSLVYYALIKIGEYLSK